MIDKEVNAMYDLYKNGLLDEEQKKKVKTLLSEQIKYYEQQRDEVGKLDIMYDVYNKKISETKTMLKNMGDYSVPNLRNQFLSLFNDVTTKGGNAFNSLGTIVNNLTGGVISMFQSTMSQGKLTFSNLANMLSGLSSAAGSFFTTLTGANIKLIGPTLKNILTNQINNIIKKFNSFDIGTNYVPNDQIAIVHKGEAIVPKKYNPAIGGNTNNNEDVVNAINVLNQTLINKNMNAYISRDDIGKASVDYINNKTRQLGESVIS